MPRYCPRNASPLRRLTATSAGSSSTSGTRGWGRGWRPFWKSSPTKTSSLPLELVSGRLLLRPGGSAASLKERVLRGALVHGGSSDTTSYLLMMPEYPACLKFCWIGWCLWCSLSAWGSWYTPEPWRHFSLFWIQNLSRISFWHLSVFLTSPNMWSVFSLLPDYGGGGGASKFKAGGTVTSAIVNYQ